MAFTFLTAEWRKLIMAQYEVAPEVLLPYVPRGLELDFYEGRCFVSLVGFLFDRVRLLGLPIPWHTRFEEINLRFYVRRPMADGTSRRGVIFISEIVPKAAITITANMLYGEAYSTAKTRHAWITDGGELSVSYEWAHKQQWQSVRVCAGMTPQDICAGSMEEFITEHYWGYTKGRNGGATEYAVEHARWKVYPVASAEVHADFGSLYGSRFASLTQRPPDHVLLAEGAPVAIRWAAR